MRDPHTIQHGTILSQMGFFIGDVCYALSDAALKKWSRHNIKQGVVTISERIGFSFVSADTYYGDGVYKAKIKNSDSNQIVEVLLPVDAGNIGIVPIDMIEEQEAHRINRSELGYYVNGTSAELFRDTKGHYEITIRGIDLDETKNIQISIDTMC